MLGRLVRGENLPPRICGMFYKAVVQAVLLYGSETWALTETAMRVLEGFHIRLAYRMAKVHKPRKNSSTCVWTYPSSVDVLNKVGLKTIREYILVRRNTIAAYIRDRPIFNLCVDAERKRGTSPRLYWWEQPLDSEMSEGLVELM